jgi:hypothetical protein
MRSGLRVRSWVKVLGRELSGLILSEIAVDPK